MSISLRASWLCLLLALPACGSDGGDDFEFGAAEMQAAAVGSWQGAWTPIDGAPSTHTLEIGLASTAGTSPLLCGTREFGAPSGAAPSSLSCVTSSLLHVEATLDVGDGSLSAQALAGWFEIYGETFRNGGLLLTGADGLELSAGWSEGSWVRCEVRRASTTAPPAKLADCTLEPGG